jgi:hypothetical protein
MRTTARWCFAVVALSLAAVGCVSRTSCPSGQLQPAARTPRFVVVRSDRSSSALALLDADGAVIDADWIDSGTRVSSLVTGLSADVVVPSTPIGGIAWIDRYAVDVLTIASPAGMIEAQIDLLGVTGTHDGYTSNPHDALRLADGRILVTRHNLNPNPDATELSRGNDVVVIEDGRVVDAIELHADEANILARADALLPLSSGDQHRVLVTLARLDARFEQAGPGAALVLDEALAPAAPVTFGALQNCWSASLDPDDASRAYVLCAGLLRGTDAERFGHAGVVELTLSEAGDLEITGTVIAASIDAMPSGGLVAVGGRRVLAVRFGTTLPATPDRLLEIDLASGATREILSARAGAFVLGDGTFDAVNDVALVPDAETGTILRIDATSLALVGEITLDGCLGLPPREIAPL